MSEKRQRAASVASRYTAEEWAKLVTKARTVGLTVGQYQRAAALLAIKLPLPHVRRRPTPDMEELRRLLGQIGKIGSNLNQIAHVLNAGGAPLPADLLEYVLLSVADMRSAVRSALAGGDE